jgi:hypothetical protein
VCYGYLLRFDASVANVRGETMSRDPRGNLANYLFMNQFLEGPRKGEFGINTDFTSRQQYHPDRQEAVRLTPQMFLTYMGVHALRYSRAKGWQERAALAASFAKSLLVDNLVRIQRPFQSPDRDSTPNGSAINLRHSALAHSLLLSYLGSDRSTKAFVRTLLEPRLQNDDGGWPEWSIPPRASNITSSVYIAHFLHQFIDQQPADDYKVLIENAISSTLTFLKGTQVEGLWPQENRETSIRFYPTLYLLILPVLLHSEGAHRSIIEDYPHLVNRLSQNGWIELGDSAKVYRTTVRYASNLYLNTFLDRNSVPLYLQMKSNVMSELEGNIPELNTHEIFGLFLMIDNIRFDPHTGKQIDEVLHLKGAGRALDWLSPLLHIIPLVGASLYEYYTKIKTSRQKDH